MRGADANIGLDDDRIPDLLHEFSAGCPVCDTVLAGSGNAGVQVNLLHPGFFLDVFNPVRLNAGGNVEIRPQPGILLQPVLIHGLNPADLTVSEGKEGDRPVNLIIVLQGIHPVIFRKRFLQAAFQAVVRGVANAQHVYAVPLQPVAELPVGVRKMRRDKHEIHRPASFLALQFSPRSHGRKYRDCLYHQGQSWLTS